MNRAPPQVLVLSLFFVCAITEQCMFQTQMPNVKRVAKLNWRTFVLQLSALAHCISSVMGG